MSITDPRHCGCAKSPDSPTWGVLFPTEFDDREACRDGKVFIARCDACGRFEDDVDAAKFIAILMGWKFSTSYDQYDAVDPDERKEKLGQPWYRPYFACTLKEAEAVP